MKRLHHIIGEKDESLFNLVTGKGFLSMTQNAEAIGKRQVRLTTYFFNLHEKKTHHKQSLRKLTNEEKPFIACTTD